MTANELIEEHFHISMKTSWYLSHGEIFLYPLQCVHSVPSVVIANKRWFTD